MTAADQYLDTIQARLNAATPGPWFEFHENGTPGELEAFHCPPATGAFLVKYADWDQQNKDAEFIANAPTDINRLLAAIEATLNLHAPRTDGSSEPYCRHCHQAPYGHAPYPCPTVAALSEALGGGE